MRLATKVTKDSKVSDGIASGWRYVRGVAGMLFSWPSCASWLTAL